MIPSNSWFPTSLQERAAWLDNFANQFAILAVPLGFTAATATAVSDDNEAFQFCASQTVEVEAFARAFRAYRQTLTEGEIGGRPPAYPANPTTVPPNTVGAGLFERLDELVRQIRVSSNYTPEIGALLGIVPESTVRPAPEDMQPELKVSTLPGSVVQVKFVRGYSSGIVLETKLDNSDNWTNVGIFPASPAVVVVPQNAENLPRSVQIRARYVEGNSPVGQFSPIVTTATQPTA